MLVYAFDVNVCEEEFEWQIKWSLSKYGLYWYFELFSNCIVKMILNKTFKNRISFAG